jgi:hypothetical protein
MISAVKALAIESHPLRTGLPSFQSVLILLGTIVGSSIAPIAAHHFEIELEFDALGLGTTS